MSPKGRWSPSWPLSQAEGQGALGGQGATGRCQGGVWFLPESGGVGPWEPGQRVLASPLAQGARADRQSYKGNQGRGRAKFSHCQKLRQAAASKGQAWEDSTWEAKRLGPCRAGSRASEERGGPRRSKGGNPGLWFGVGSGTKPEVGPAAPELPRPPSPTARALAILSPTRDQPTGQGARGSEDSSHEPPSKINDSIPMTPANACPAPSRRIPGSWTPR